MASVEISAKTGDSDPIKTSYDFGADDDAMVKKHGLAIVCSYAKAAMKVAIQDVIRAGILAGKPNTEIQKDVAAMKFGIKKRGKSRAEKLASQFDALDPAEKSRLLKELAA